MNLHALRWLIFIWAAITPIIGLASSPDPKMISPLEFHVSGNLLRVSVPIAEQSSDFPRERPTFSFDATNKLNENSRVLFHGVWDKKGLFSVLHWTVEVNVIASKTEKYGDLRCEISLSRLARDEHEKAVEFFGDFPSRPRYPLLKEHAIRPIDGGTAFFYSTSYKNSDGGDDVLLVPVSENVLVRVVVRNLGIVPASNGAARLRQMQALRDAILDSVSVDHSWISAQTCR